MIETIASLNKVSFLYPKSPDFAIKDITLDIRKGEFLGLIGPTGAGKSTFCMTLNGIVPQFFSGRFFGHVTIDGLDTLDYPISSFARTVGIVFEDPETQITATSVENEIAFALENLKVPRDEIIARIPQVLEAVRLEGMGKKHPHELSGGQKQRLAIAAVLALKPKVLVLDEPTSLLDPIGSVEVFATVRELNKELGMTVVMSSHAAEEMAEYADRIALIAGGEIKKIASPSEIYSAVEYLRENDLRPPQVASTFHIINEFGLSIPEIPVRLKQGIETLANITIHHDIWDQPITQSPKLSQGGDGALLSVKDLYYTYNDGSHALDGINLDVHEGEYVLIIGQNGAGKSTLVKHFVKLLEPTKGIVSVGGMDTRSLTVSQLARRIGYVAQNPDNQIFNTTIQDEVSFALKLSGYVPEEIETRVAEGLEAMELSDVRDRHPLSLPKGDRARVVIAAILAMQPEIIIFDEPTTGQDYRGAMNILELSKKFHKKGKTIIVITHHLYLMPEFAERVIVMGKGTILLDAPIRQAFHEIELLKATYLKPPQAVSLAQTINTEHVLQLITPLEVAAYVTGRRINNIRGIT